MAKRVIKRMFVQKRVATDCEARNWEWEDTKKTYEALKEKLTNEWDGWFDGVRVVEKVFDEETFTITENPIKMARRVYNGFHWVSGEIEETTEF